MIGPTAGRFLIDVTAGNSAKQFVRGEWFVGTAVLTSLIYLICAKYLGLTIYPATLIAFCGGLLLPGRGAVVRLGGAAAARCRRMSSGEVAKHAQRSRRRCGRIGSQNTS